MSAHSTHSPRCIATHPLYPPLVSATIARVTGDIDAFLDHLRATRGAADSTLSAYAADLGQLARELGRRRSLRDWSQVTPAALRRYFASLHGRDYARTSIARKLAAARSFFRYLVRRGALPRSPASGLTAPRLRRPLPRFLYPDEVEALLAAPPPTRPWGCATGHCSRPSTPPGCG